jgi:hypothetical protein
MEAMMKRPLRALFSLLALLLLLAGPAFPASAQLTLDPNPPAQAVKLLFIHHSTGENWLRDDYGGLGKALAENNYFVSDTNYGWGPEAIGDRTDIPDWEEWFDSPRTPATMQAAYTESGQNSSYTRLPNDPGGENTIVLFKSCFPNSALEGSPDDPPNPEGWLTVGHARYVYNRLLPYFLSRPDKLFIVITAPPLSDNTYASNARAFNTWLLEDWLQESGYPLHNVAVFDFYNVLSAKQAHHWFADGQIRHVVQERNILAYPSGDDHPNEAGSRKATDEFVPLLNIFYHRWIESGNQNLPVANPAAPTQAAASEPSSGEGQAGEIPAGAVPPPPGTLLLVEDFESGAGWEPNWDASTGSAITCYADQGTGLDGSASLLMDFSITPGSWGNCALFFDAVQDWSAGDLLSFQVHSQQAGLRFSVAVYGGTPDASQTFHKYMETGAGTAAGYVEYVVPWDQLQRPEWEENPGSPFTETVGVMGVSFGVEAAGEAPTNGMLWFDQVSVKKLPGSMTGGQPQPTQGTVEEPETEAAEGEDAVEPERGSPFSKLPCLGGALLPVVMFGGVVVVAGRKRVERSERSKKS